MSQDSAMEAYIDQMKLLRQELAEVKKRQLTSDQLNKLIALLHKAMTKIDSVQDAAAQGGKSAVNHHAHSLQQQIGDIERTVDGAVRSLTEARNDRVANLHKQLGWRINLQYLSAACLGTGFGFLMGFIAFGAHIWLPPLRNALSWIGL
jgi:DNA repair ATPase RecN